MNEQQAEEAAARVVEWAAARIVSVEAVRAYALDHDLELSPPVLPVPRDCEDTTLERFFLFVDDSGNRRKLRTRIRIPGDIARTVVSLSEHRAALNAAAAARGEMFEFALLEDPEMTVGSTDDAVVLRFDASSMKGYAMSPEAARKFAIALIEAAGFIDLQKDGMINFPEDDELETPG